MKAGQITAKLRAAVPVHFFSDGEDRIQYKNIEIPDILKTLEIMDFGFDVSEESKISFRLFFDNGILPAEFPPARPMMTRVAKAATPRNSGFGAITTRMPASAGFFMEKIIGMTKKVP